MKLAFISLCFLVFLLSFCGYLFWFNHAERQPISFTHVTLGQYTQRPVTSMIFI